MSAVVSRDTPPPDPLLFDPEARDLWRHEHAWWAPIRRRPHALAVAMALGMLTLMGAIAIAADLPIRDADGILGGRFIILAGTTAAFFVLDLIPRAARRSRRSPRRLPAAIREVVAERWTWRRLGVVVMGLCSFYGTYLAYRNIKSFLPFLVQQDLDAPLLQLERTLFGTDPALVLHEVLGTGIAAHVLSAVYLFFLAFVPITLGAALILSVNPVPGLWYVTSLSINWTLGVGSYYVLPALGPVFAEPALFANLPETGTSALQQTLIVERAIVLADPSSFPGVQSIAAFASLHVSIVFTAALIAHLLRLDRRLRWALWTFLGLTLLSTIYFGWHYVIDDLAGLAIGAVAVAGGAAATGHWGALRRRRRGLAVEG